MMKIKTDLLMKLSLALLLITTGGLAQTPKQTSAKEKGLQTVRIHIDGFVKSKSGAV